MRDLTVVGVANAARMTFDGIDINSDAFGEGFYEC